MNCIKREGRIKEKQYLRRFENSPLLAVQNESSMVVINSKGIKHNNFINTSLFTAFFLILVKIFYGLPNFFKIQVVYILENQSPYTCL